MTLLTLCASLELGILKVSYTCIEKLPISFVSVALTPIVLPLDSMTERMFPFGKFSPQLV